MSTTLIFQYCLHKLCIVDTIESLYSKWTPWRNRAEILTYVCPWWQILRDISNYRDHNIRMTIAPQNRERLNRCFLWLHINIRWDFLKFLYGYGLIVNTVHRECVVLEWRHWLDDPVQSRESYELLGTLWSFIYTCLQFCHCVYGVNRTPGFEHIHVPSYWHSSTFVTYSCSTFIYLAYML